MDVLKLYYEKEITIVNQACTKIKGFAALRYRLLQNVIITGKSQSMFNNYIRHIAMVALHFNCMPTKLTAEQVQDFLFLVKQQHKTTSESFFKFTIYGLRYVFRMEGLEEKHLKLPQIKHIKKLPIVLSPQEVKRLLLAPKLLKHRIMIAMLYGCGLRSAELLNITLSDIDFDRRMLHIRQGKNKKDRYVPLGEMLIRGLKKYIEKDKPQYWLLNGYLYSQNADNTNNNYTTNGIRWAVSQARKVAGISKRLTTHTLRHTYATHLLEDGLDIVSIKNLLGHERIETTMIYLHIAQSGRIKPYSPLERLYESPKNKFVSMYSQYIE